MFCSWIFFPFNNFSGSGDPGMSLRGNSRVKTGGRSILSSSKLPHVSRMAAVTMPLISPLQKHTLASSPHTTA